VASTFAEGWEALTSLEPDVALVDIGLPDGSGLDLARRLHEKGHHRPKLLAAVSGYGQPSDIRTSEEAGFDRHIVKPLRMDVLLSLLGVDE